MLTTLQAAQDGPDTWRPQVEPTGAGGLSAGRLRGQVRVGWALLSGLTLLLVGAPGILADDNILSPGRGARVLKRTSEDPAASAANLIDERGPGGWRSGDGTIPQEIIFQLPAVTRFNTLVFTLAGGEPGEWPRDVEVYAAEPFPTMGGWRLAGRVTLTARAGDQAVTVPAIEGRFIRLLILSAQREGAPRISLGRLKIFAR